MTGDTPIGGATLTSLEDAACRRLVDQILSARTTTRAARPSAWLIAHGIDGVTWGAGGDDRWSLADDAFPDFAPPLAHDSLLSLRVFDEAAETLVWRDGDAGLRGRELRDAPEGPAAVSRSQWSPERHEATVPIEEWQILIGDGGHPPDFGNGFSLLTATTGARHVVPMAWEPGEAPAARPAALCVRHYLAQQDETIGLRSGAVRVVASRLVRLDFLPTR